jgi:hypothetical protein
MSKSKRIDGQEYGECIHVSPFDEDVWLHMMVRGATMHITITKAKAAELVEELNKIIAGSAE